MTKPLFISGLALCAGLLLAQTDQQNMPAQTNSNGAIQNDSTTASGNSWTGLLVATGCDNGTGSMNSSNMSRTTPTQSANGAMTGPALNGSSGSGMNGTSTDTTGSGATGTTQTRTDNRTTTAPAPDMARATSPVQSDTYGSSANHDNVNTTGTADRNSAIDSSSGTADRAAGGAATSTPMATDQNFPKSTASAASESSGSMNRATDATAGMQKNTSDTGRAMAANTDHQGDWDSAKMAAGQLGASCRISSTTSSFALRLPDGRLIPFDSASNAKIADQVHDRVSGRTKIFRVVVTGTMSGDTITMESIRL